MYGLASVLLIHNATINVVMQISEFKVFAQFISNNMPDIVALISGVLGVWLTIKQNIWCWPMALLSVLISLVIFYQQRLYGDMSLQVVYFFGGIYGWLYWNKHKGNDFKVSRTPKSYAAFLLAATILQALLYYFLLVYFGGDKPVFDAILTATSLTATYMMTKKWLENWLMWIFIDASYVLLYSLKHMWLFALLYLFFTLMATLGWIKWKKTTYSE